MVKTFTLFSPRKLLNNLGALSEYAKCSQSLTKMKKIKILILYLRYNGVVKKPSHATVPLRPEYMYLALRAAKTAKVGRQTAAEWAGLSQYTRDSRVIAIFFSATDIDIRYETSKKPRQS